MCASRPDDSRSRWRRGLPRVTPLKTVCEGRCVARPVRLRAPDLERRPDSVGAGRAGEHYLIVQAPRGTRITASEYIKKCTLCSGCACPSQWAMAVRGDVVDQSGLHVGIVYDRSFRDRTTREKSRCGAEVPVPHRKSRRRGPMRKTAPESAAIAAYLRFPRRSNTVSVSACFGHHGVSPLG